MADEVDAGDAGLSRVEVEGPERFPERPVILLVAAQVDAELQKVPSLRPAQRVGDAPAVVGLEIILGIADADRN